LHPARSGIVSPPSSPRGPRARRWSPRRPAQSERRAHAVGPGGPRADAPRHGSGGRPQRDVPGRGSRDSWPSISGAAEGGRGVNPRSLGAVHREAPPG